MFDSSIDGTAVGSEFSDGGAVWTVAVVGSNEDHGFNSPFLVSPAYSLQMTPVLLSRLIIS
jgi:hypothetical protein